MRATRTWHIFGAVVGATLALFRCGDARADIYDDAKEIVLQLIEDNIAREAIPNAAQHVEVVCKYFPATIHAIEMKRFDGVRTVLRKEAADSIGLVVLWELVRTIKKPVPAIAHAIPGDQKLNKTIEALAFTVNGHVGAQLEPADMAGCPDVATRKRDGNAFRGLESLATGVMRACAPTQNDLESEAACSVALLVRDVANGDEKLVSHDIRRAGAAFAVSAMNRAEITTNAAQIVPLLSEFVTALEGHLSASEVATNVCTTSHKKSPILTGCTDAATTAFAAVRGAQANLDTLEQGLGLLGTFTRTLSTSFAFSAEFASKVADVASGAQTVMKELQAKNYGAAVGSALDAVAQLNCASKDAEDKPGCTDEDKSVYRFLHALAVYSVDSLVSGNTATTGAAFRQAAVDFIEAQSGLGINRSLSLNRGGFAGRIWPYYLIPAKGVLVPEFALRNAYQPPYLAPGAPRSFVYPSVDFVRAHLPVSEIAKWRHVYFAAQGSAIDILGPFTEIATRDSSLAHSGAAGWVFLLGFVVPRVDLEVGFPDLTTHVVVGAGGALRFYRAKGEPGNARYCVAGAGGGCDNMNFDNYEMSLFVKYVP